MNALTGAVILGGITVVANAIFRSTDSKLQACIDSYTFTNERNSYELDQCLKGHFPSKFADAYRRKLEAQSKLVEANQ